MQPRGSLGHDEASPLTLGAPNGAAPQLVEATGLFLSVRKGKRRWVTGTAVRGGLAGGQLITVFDSRRAKPEREVEIEAPVVEPPGPASGVAIPPPAPAPSDTDLAKLQRQHEAVLQGAETPDATAAVQAAPEPQTATEGPSRQQLVDRAKTLKLTGYSKLSRDALTALIAKAEAK